MRRPLPWSAGLVLAALIAVAWLVDLPGVRGPQGDAASVASRGRRPEPGLVVAAPADGDDASEGEGAGADLGGGGPGDAVDAVQTHVLVRDLLDGSVRPALEIALVQDAPARSRAAALAFARGGDATTRTADAAGRVQVPAALRGEGAWLLPADAPWLAANPERALATGTLWVFRTLTLHVAVEGDGAPLDPRRATATVAFLDVADAARYAPAGVTPQDRTAARDWAFLVGRRVTNGTGDPPLTLPRCRGYLVRATATGFQSAWQILDPGRAGAVLHVRLRLRPAPVVAGTVRDAQERPVPDAELLVRVVVPAPRERPAVDALMQSVGWNAIGAGGRADPHVRFERTFTPTDGAFRVSLPVEGVVRLEARAAGHTTATADLGTVEGHRQDVALVLPRRRGTVPTHTVLRGAGAGRAASAAPLHLLKIEGTAVTKRIAVTPDARGRIPVADLERGMRYLVVAALPPAPEEVLGAFTWEEQEEIVLEAR